MENILHLRTFRTQADEPSMKNLTKGHFSKTTWGTALVGAGGAVNTIFWFDFIGSGHLVSSR